MKILALSLFLLFGAGSCMSQTTNLVWVSNTNAILVMEADDSAACQAGFWGGFGVMGVICVLAVGLWSLRVVVSGGDNEGND